MIPMDEDLRNSLMMQGRHGRKERDGKSRYEKRKKSKVASAVKEFNQLNMDDFFKKGILTIDIPVQGETNNYSVKIKFGEILDTLQEKVKDNSNKFELKTVLTTLTAMFDKTDVYIHCSCPDWQYRMSYFATINNINSGEPELRPSDITNPRNDLGPGCKHVMLVLSNNKWLVKVAEVINNYVKYMQVHHQKAYADIIYPAIYGKKYEGEVQMSISDNDEFGSEEEINKANEVGRTSGRFKQGNQYRFQPSNNKPIRNQKSFSDEE